METAEEFIQRKEKQFKEEKNKLVKMKDIGRKGKHLWIRENWVFLPQSNYAEKVFVVERFKRVEPEGDIVQKGNIGDIEYRIGYYIVGRIGNRNRKWTWGQYCPIIPKEDLKKLMELAKEKGVIFG